MPSSKKNKIDSEKTVEDDILETTNKCCGCQQIEVDSGNMGE
jgi:hypothetical protein